MRVVDFCATLSEVAVLQQNVHEETVVPILEGKKKGGLIRQGKETSKTLEKQTNKSPQSPNLIFLKSFSILVGLSWVTFIFRKYFPSLRITFL